MINPEDIVWRCHICGKTRPDDKISVFQKTYKDEIEILINVRYCNDNSDCEAKAPWLAHSVITNEIQNIRDELQTIFAEKDEL